LTADAIDLNRTKARGVQALKTFLAYAQTGRLDVPTAAGGETDSPFDASVFAALKTAGHQVRRQVGSASSRIDLAVVDPAQPERYMLAIESDGASYQSARSARDRDRLRQMVLEGLGWRFHRVWSTEWFRDPERELKRAVLAIEQARLASPPPAPPAETVDRREEVQAEAEAGAELVGELPRSVAIPVYQVTALKLDLGGRDLHEIPAPQLAACVFEVVRLEGPVQTSEVTRRIADAAGVKRVGTRIQAAIDLAVDQATRQGGVRRDGDFLWPADMRVAVVRDRCDLPAAMRKLDLVATEEIAAAVERVVVDAFGMEPSAIPPAACRLLGFNRLSDEMRRRLDAIVAAMLADKRLIVRGEHLVIPDLKVAG
jgi:very-short-patch-repair endonuclease